MVATDFNEKGYSTMIVNAERAFLGARKYLADEAKGSSNAGSQVILRESRGLAVAAEDKEYASRFRN